MPNHGICAEPISGKSPFVSSRRAGAAVCVGSGMPIMADKSVFTLQDAQRDSPLARRS